MAKIVDDNVMVCTDCVMYIANGELPDDGPWKSKHFERNWADFNVVNGDSDKDEEFSWHACDGCDSKLGGARFHCVAFEDDEETEQAL
jgi:hypothetical protein